MPKILVLNGPNLGLLGKREPEHYGCDSLDTIETGLKKQATAANCELAFYQSNAEHEIIDRVHAAAEENIGFIIINPAAFTHTSVAIRDALLAVNIPFIEVHLSNVFKREAFRHHSYFSDVAVGVISGLGALGYELALRYAINSFNT